MNTEPSSHLQRPRAFVMRIILDAQGDLRGQISEPSSAEEWRATFASADELWRCLAERLACPPEPSSPSYERSNDELRTCTTD